MLKLAEWRVTPRNKHFPLKSFEVSCLNVFFFFSIIELNYKIEVFCRLTSSNEIWLSWQNTLTRLSSPPLPLALSLQHLEHLIAHEKQNHLKSERDGKTFQLPGFILDQIR